MAGLRLLKGKYYVRVWFRDPHGKTKEKLLPTGTSNKIDALRVLRRIEKEELEIKQKLRDEISYLNNRLTIEQGIRFFLKNVGKERGLRETTIKSYRLGCRDFLNAFKDKVYFENLRKEDYPTLIKYLSSRYNKVTTNIRLRSVRAMLNYLYEKEKIREIPFKVKQVKVDDNLPKFIRPSEFEKILEHTEDKRLKIVFKVYYETGLRLDELNNSHRDGNFVVVTHSKTGKQRIVPLPNPEEYDLAKAFNFSKYFITRKFSEVCRKIGLKGKTIHCLRHSFALKKLLETNNVYTVKELLGHSTVKVTEIYLKFNPEYLKEIFTNN